jgi:hypothetical protein
MAGSDTKPGMGAGERHVYGPRQVAALMPMVPRAASRRRAPAAAQIMIDWPAIVGPALAAITAPRGLSAGRLTIACAGPVAMELAHLSDELRGRINGHLGKPLVTALRFVQTLDAPRPAAPPPPPPARAFARAADAVADLPEGGLKAALAALGALVLAAEPDNKSAANAPKPSPSTRLPEKR